MAKSNKYALRAKKAWETRRANAAPKQTITESVVTKEVEEPSLRSNVKKYFTYQLLAKKLNDKSILKSAGYRKIKSDLFSTLELDKDNPSLI